MRKYIWGVLTALGVLSLLLVGCGGGSESVGGAIPGESSGPPVISGSIIDSPNAAVLPQVTPAKGQLTSAPLGTDPEFDVREASAVIATRPVSRASSVGKSASTDDPLLWVAVAARDEEPVPGLGDQSFLEGDEVDLYICYRVFDGQLTISRNWCLAAAGLHYTEGAVAHPQAGTYEAKFPFVLPCGSAGLEAEFIGAVGYPKETSVFVVPEMGNSRSVKFEIEAATLLPPVDYPEDPPDEENDEPVGCLPRWMRVTWASDTEVIVESEKPLSNVVLGFADGVHERWDDLEHDPDRTNSGSFWGRGENGGKTIENVWAKAGCNKGGSGPHYGQQFRRTYQERIAMAQMHWEDLPAGSDHDYNDFVGRIHASEQRNEYNELMQMDMTVKAIARSAGYDSDWQLNIGASFPTAGDDVIAIVNQFYDDGTPHGDQRIYFSIGGMSVPVFTPLRDALPNPPGSTSTNGVPGTQFVAGDYAEVTILFGTPLAQGTYTPMPYKPEIKVKPANDSDVYTIGLWTEPGDPTGADGLPLAFIVPDTLSWPLEGRPIWECYAGFDYWVQWINDQSLDEPLLMWYDDTPVVEKSFGREKFTPWPEN